MKRTLSAMLAAAGLAAAFAVGVTLPSSAAPSAGRAPATRVVERGDALLAERGAVKQHVGDRDARTEALPPRTEGVAGGFVFVPITPFRTLDSRNYSDGFMFGGDEVVFSVLTDEFNTPRIPSTAVAVTYNLTVDGTFGSGFCSVYPGPDDWPGNSSINWRSANQTIANGGVSGVGFYDQFGQVSVYCGPTSFSIGTDFILDITGYYI